MNRFQRKHTAIMTRIRSMKPKASSQHCAMLMNFHFGIRYQESELLYISMNHCCRLES